MNGERAPRHLYPLCSRRLLSALALAWACVADAGPLYRWVDGHGQVHFSDVPAPGAQRLNLQAATPRSAPRYPGAATGPQGADALRMSADCQKLKGQLKAYRAAATITETDALGKTHSFSDVEKRQLIALTDMRMRKACGLPPAAPASGPAGSQAR